LTYHQRSSRIFGFIVKHIRQCDRLIVRGAKIRQKQAELIASHNNY
jgi:hypothetical protein